MKGRRPVLSTVRIYLESRTMLVPAVGVLFFGLSACHREPPRIEGQVFIALKNGETVKLSAVPVFLVESNAAINRFNSGGAGELQKLDRQRLDTLQKMNGLSDELAKLQDQWLLEAPHNERYVKARADFEAWQKKPDSAPLTPYERGIRDEYVKGLKANIERLRSELIGSRLIKLEDEINSVSRRVEAIRLQLAELERVRRTCADDVRSLFHGEWPGIIASGVTDPEGKFSFKLPANKDCMLVAAASREIGDKTERYYWLLPAGRSRDSLVLLNNANLLDLEAR